MTTRRDNLDRWLQDYIAVENLLLQTLSEEDAAVVFRHLLEEVCAIYRHYTGLTPVVEDGVVLCVKGKWGFRASGQYRPSPFRPPPRH